MQTTSPRTCPRCSALTRAAMDTSMLRGRLVRSSSTIWTCAKQIAPRTKTANRSPTITRRSSVPCPPLPLIHPMATKFGAPTFRPTPSIPVHHLLIPTRCCALACKAVGSLMAHPIGSCSQMSAPRTHARNGVPLMRSAKPSRTARVCNGAPSHGGCLRRSSSRTALAARIGSQRIRPTAWANATRTTAPRTRLRRSVLTPAAMDTSILPSRLVRSTPPTWTCAKKHAPRTKTANRSPTISTPSSAPCPPLPQTHPAPRPTAANRGAPTTRPSPSPPAHHLLIPTPCGVSTHRAMASLTVSLMGRCSRISAPRMHARNGVPLTRGAKPSRTACVCSGAPSHGGR